MWKKTDVHYKWWYQLCRPYGHFFSLLELSDDRVMHNGPAPSQNDETDVYFTHLSNVISMHKTMPASMICEFRDTISDCYFLSKIVDFVLF